MTAKKSNRSEDKNSVKTASKVVKSDTGITEARVKNLIQESVSGVTAGVEELKETVMLFMASVNKPTEVVETPEAVPAAEVPPVPEPPKEDSGHTEDFGNKDEVEISSRSLGGVINEKGVPWNMFIVSIALAVIVAAILTSMYFLHSALKISPLEVEFPEELEYKDVTEVHLGIPGTALVYAVGEEKPIRWRYEDGTLSLNPKAEGSYAISVVIASGREVRSGYFQFESVEGAGDNRYDKIAGEVKAAIESTIPEEQRSFCKSVGDNYKAVAITKPSTLDAFGAAIRSKNSDTLGFSSEAPKLSNEANWFALLKNGGPISDIIVKYVGDNPSKEVLSRVLLAISEGFYSVKC